MTWYEHEETPMPGSVDFVRQLDKQLRFIEASCREYDAGNVDEGIRIATALRVIFHHTAASTSLLTHLCAMNTEILSTAGRRPGSHPDGYWPALVQIKYDVATNTLECNPTFDCRPSAHRMLPASAWWDTELVFYGGRKRFKRKPLVLHAANKDGGAHVDSELPEDYEWLLNGADVAMGLITADGQDLTRRLPNPHLAYLRQMGHEVLHSPELLKLAGR
jgi:hypothetical protein